MSNASKMQSQNPPEGSIRRHRVWWTAVAVLIAVGFFMMWTLGNFGTPPNPGMPDPLVNKPIVTAPAQK